MDLTTGLLMLRNAYLQCIATAWEDDEYREEVLTQYDTQTGKPVKANDVLQDKKFTKFFPKGVDLDWRVNVYLVDLLNEGLRYGTVYSPFGNNTINGWIGGTDAMIIKIPQAPKKKDQTEALAAYYDLFNTMLGNPERGTAGSVDSNRKIDESTVRLFRLIRDTVPAEELVSLNASSTLGDGGADQFNAFGSTMLTVIAACWSNPAYLEYLTSPQMVLTPYGTRNSQIKDKFLTFDNPWFFNIKFESACTKWEKGKWKNIENNEILLHFPTVPENLEDESPIALSRYNNTGPAYPFTCT